MVDFLDSFNKGISAAKQAAENMHEINGVIETLSKQLEAATDGAIKIAIKDKSNVFNALFSSIDQASMKTQQFIIAFNPLGEYKPKELAEWKVDENGYPCRLITPDTEFYCEDKEALELYLGSLLASPTTGKKLKAIMDQPVKP
jgi:hypothetical protein